MKLKLSTFAVAIFSVFALCAAPAANAWEFSWNDEVKASVADKHAAEIKAAKLEGKLEAESAQRAAVAARAEADRLKSQQALGRTEAARKGWHVRAVRAEAKAKNAKMQLAALKAKPAKKRHA